MQELPVTWGRVLSVWWLFTWRAVVGSMLLGAVSGFVIGLVGAVTGETPAAEALAIIVGAVLGIGWAFIVVRMMLRKRYKDFRLALVPVD